MSEVLVEGDYGGSADDVLRVCRHEINDGAAVVLTPARSTPLGRLVGAAQIAQLRSPAIQVEPGQREVRTRIRRPPGRALVAGIEAGTESLRTRPAAAADAVPRSARTLQVWRLWGDGWVIRQAVALTPAAVDLTAVASSVAAQEPALAAVVRRVVS
jgi:hypothetical protein